MACSLTRVLLVLSWHSILCSCATLKDKDTCAQDTAEGNRCLLQGMSSSRKTVVVEAAEEAREADHESAERQERPRPSNNIPNSNRKGSRACKCTRSDCIGEVCDYTCDEGYIPVGKHVYREYVRKGVTILPKGFFGGRCEKLCTGHDTCKGNEVPVRSWNEKQKCLANACVAAVGRTRIGSGNAEDEALVRLAKGNWALWQIARQPDSGLYVDNINARMHPAWRRGKADVTGCGLIMECIAVSMGFQSKNAAAKRILQTLRALSARLPKVNQIGRSVIGKFFPGIMDTRTGKNPRGGRGGNTVATGLMFGGILFAKTYFQRNFPHDPKTKRIAEFAVELFEHTEWDKMVCSKNSRVDPMKGMKVAWDVTEDGRCLNPAAIRNGKLRFNEAYVGRWFAYKWACTVKKTKSCSNMKRMWKAQQATKTRGIKWSNPNSDLTDMQILSKWGSYVVQLPYFMSHPFNSDKDFQKMFFKSYSVEKELYEHSPYFAPDRYGLGAGPTGKWCADIGYVADRLGGDAGCKTYSPHGVVGYLATGDPQVKKDVLKMLADGEAVTMVKDPVTGQAYPVLDRRMLLDPEWRPYAITMIDVSGELFGLAAYFLGNDFFMENTNFFDNPKAPWV